MFKRTSSRLAVGAVTALSVLGLVAGTATSASAATVKPHRSWLPELLYGEGLWSPANQVIMPLSQGTAVEVTCYYTGNAGGYYPIDGYWDHVDYIVGIGDVVGHVDDNAVDFGGKTPPEMGIPHC